MEQKNGYSAKHVIAACIIGAFAGAVFGGIEKIFNLNIDSSVVLILTFAIAFGSLWLYLMIIKKRKK